MKNLLAVFVTLSFACIISCTEDVKVYPSTNTTTTLYLGDTAKMVNPDPAVEKFIDLLTDSVWVCTRTSVTDLDHFIGTDTVNCNYEQQFDFLKTMTISRQTNSTDLKVVNTYVCRSEPRITYFEIARVACCGFVIIEKNAGGAMIKVYDFILPNGQTFWADYLLDSPDERIGMTLFCTTLDTSYFYITAKGTLKKLPTFYAVFIQKR